MNNTNEDNCFVAFTGIEPKPPGPPDWLFLIRHSEDFGGWEIKDKTDKRKKKKKKGRKTHGKK